MTGPAPSPEPRDAAGPGVSLLTLLRAEREAEDEGLPPQEQVQQGRNDCSPGVAAGAGLRSARLCPIRQGKARMPTPEMRPRRGQSTGPAVTRTCRRALPGGSRAAAWGPGAGGLAAVSSPHLPEGTGGRCSALIHKCGRGPRASAGSRGTARPGLPVAPSCLPPGPSSEGSVLSLQKEAKTAVEAAHGRVQSRALHRKPQRSRGQGPPRRGFPGDSRWPAGLPAGPHPGAQGGSPQPPVTIALRDFLSNL